MSELINAHDNRATIRWKLLTGVSALVLTAYISSTALAGAEDADRPTIWIELGGQMEAIGGQGAAFAPAFLTNYATSSVFQKTTPVQAQKPPFSFGEDGKISFQPEDSNWIFSAAVRFGRSGNFRHVDHQTNRAFDQQYVTSSGHVHTYITTAANYADTQAHHHDHQAILDFSVGKDVGLGLFGSNSSSALSLGVRIAQFQSNATFDIRARPDLQIKYFPSANATPRQPFPYFHAYHATGNASRSFHGLGPSLSWNGSAPFVGNQHDGELTFDWGANAALLFGKQKAHVRHYETARYFHKAPKYYSSVYHHPVTGHDTDRSVTVPNVGGSVGLSWRKENFKFSLGYRGDFFFGAMDTGIDAAKKSNLTFNGPYASISVGIGG